MKAQLLLILAIIAVFSCAKKTTSSTRTGATQSGKYAEDLSVLRPKVNDVDTASKQPMGDGADETKETKYVEAKYAINENLDSILDSISRFNHSIGHVDGFTIQVYSGLKREEALNAKKSLSTSLPGLDSELQYVQPNYRVRAGKYYDRFAAQRDYVAIKKYFPNAILLPERLPIK
ncbi:MAG TPA: hypothetical protein VD927_18095 [Chryseosolibacter sp.]|nr:hypothetical protein [Chryseosolibacter sp.]